MLNFYFKEDIQQLHISDLPKIDHYLNRDISQLMEISKVAVEVNNNGEVLLVIGVGGSFLGARAVIDALTPYFAPNEYGVEVIYAGQNMSGAYLQQLLKYLNKKEVYVNVVSKSGTTMEPGLAFRVVKQYMEKRYGEESKQRIIVTTDAEKGVLKQIADKEGYRRFVIPSEVGGRYSVFTAAGLLPIAVAGIDIQAFLCGANQAELDLDTDNLEQNAAYQYALTRYEMYQKGYSVELLASFEPRLSKLHEWWKQLFGESEGKEYKGLYPSTVNYSTDLHAIGQFVQEGSRIMFETLIHFEEVEADMEIPFTLDDMDGLNYLGGRSMNSINAISKDGVALAHEEGGVPVVKIVMPKLDAYHVGYLMFFFMKACVMSASLLEVNPFDQPGVEAYKRKMVELLKKDAVLVNE
ncbi:glucose-6-phosphate isomerase [Ureibacillus chungkukjangi]|uniref:glucose-6-phosphate isomerase n=1 Tax=Ureibacillus chungkukjangi TaxID=1202712 RepID=UPI002040FC76|nr:glucose-6-phosphate isomerase [Ureibacillus chungkukjangi]MCM3389779.1 glucose-6-phosphate isomerase [Ureibacillus chungkukjangi]